MLVVHRNSGPDATIVGYMKKTGNDIIFPTNFNPEHLASRRRGTAECSAPRYSQENVDAANNGSHGGK